MRRELTDHQKRCVNAILANVTEYLDLRFVMSAEVNPRLRDIWPNLQYLQTAQLRNSLGNDKAWGAHRHVIAELLCGSDKQKIYDIFNPSNQSSIQGEIVEKRDDVGHKTADVLEIHDFRTLYGAIEPSVSEISAVMQIYIWWDLKDASELAKFQLKIRRIRELETQWSEEWAKYYRVVLKKKEDEGLPEKEEAVTHEYEDLKYTVENFIGRRENEPGHVIIIDRKRPSGEDPADKLIQAIAREQVLMREIEGGQKLDDAMRGQFAKALNVAEDALTAEMQTDYLARTIAEQKGRLRRVLIESKGGEPFNFKEAQAEAMKKKYEEVTAGRASMSDLTPRPTAVQIESAG